MTSPTVRVSLSLAASVSLLMEFSAIDWGSVSVMQIMLASNFP
jgi:hypothetical protein